MTRSLQSFVYAMFITLGLVFIMHSLIRMPTSNLVKPEVFKVSDFLYVPKNEESDLVIIKPDRPQENIQPVEEAIDITPTDTQISSNFGDGFSLIFTKDLNTKYDEIDTDYLPIVKYAPTYPPRARDKGLCGWVLMEFTVSTTGAVRDPKVIESSATIFERSAKNAVLKFKYKPRKQGGKLIDSYGVRNKISYQLEGGC